MLSDRRYPCFRNFNSAVSIDVIRMKSYLDSLFDPACVSVRVTIDKLDLIPLRKMLRFVCVLRNCGVLCMSKPYISVVFFYPVLHRSPFFQYTFCRIHMEFCIQHRLVCLVLGRLSVVLSKTEELCQI